MRALVSAVFSDLLPPGVVCELMEVSCVAGDGSTLFPQERAVLGRAVLKRRREFEAGRLLARRAMERLGVEAGPLLPGPRRAPVWPDAVVGSITHTRRWCAAAVAPRESFRAVGIDLEPDEPIKPPLFRMICTPPELEILEGLPPAERGRVCRIVFSAKEAAYKAQFAISETFLPFSAMTVRLHDGRFEALLNVDVGEHFARSHVFEGVYRRADGLIATALALSETAR